jgi:predicted RNase H-like nuclease (RuvC/YqgF family)
MALVTHESVEEAAKALRKSSERVSVRGVRLYLGGGSPNQILTILRHLKQTSAPQSDANIEIPMAVLGSIQKAMREAGEEAAREAQRTIKDLEGTQDELGREIQSLDATVTEQKARRNILLAELAGREKDVAKLESKVEQLLASKEDAINRLETLRQEERKRADTLATRLADEQRKLAVAETKTQAAMERAEQAELRESSASFQLEGAFRELAKLRRQRDEKEGGEQKAPPQNNM